MKYNAFISYRHTPHDMMAAKKLHRALETYHIPKSVQKLTGKKRIERVFRDQEELPIGSDLNENILNALQESEYLIVICSPETPGSYWVLKEIETFTELHDRSHVLAVLIEGEPSDSFPKPLLEDEYGKPVEPLAADIRGANSKEENQKFKTELLRLISAIIGCNYDDIKQRHKERIIKRNLAIALSVAAVVVSIAVIFGVYNARVADRMQKLADAQTKLAEEKSLLAERIKAEYRQKQINQSRSYAKQSKELLEEGSRKDATLVALEALPGTGGDRPLVSEAVYALSDTLGTYSYDYYEIDKELPHDFSLNSIARFDDYSRLVSMDISGTVYVWDPDSMELKCKIEPDGYDITTLNNFSADDSYVYVCLETEIRKYDYLGNLVAIAKSPEQDIRNCDFRTEQKSAAFSTQFNIYLLNLDTMKFDKIIRTDYKLWDGITYSPSGKCVCLEGGKTDENGKNKDGWVIVDTTSGDTLFVDFEQPFTVFDTLFTPDGNILLYYGFNGFVGDEGERLDEGFVGCFTKEGENIWTREIEHEESFDHLDLLCQNICDINGEEKYLVGVCIRNEIVIFDGENGEQLYKWKFKEKVTGMIMSDEITVCSLESGSIHMLDYANGYDETSLNTGLKNDFMTLCATSDRESYSLVFGQGQDSDLHTVVYREPCVEALTKPVGELLAVAPTGHYCVFENMGENDWRYGFYGAGGEMIYDVVSENSLLTTWFIGDVMVSFKNGDLTFYDPLNQSQETVSIFDILRDSVLAEDASEIFYENDNPYIIVSSYSSISVIDCLNKKVVYDYPGDGNRILSCCISSDSKTVILEKNVSKKGAENICYSQIFLDTGVEKQLSGVHPGDEYKVVTKFLGGNPGMKISDDKKYAAFLCNDNKIRLMNLEKDSLCAEFPVLADGVIHMEFIKGSEVFLYQKEDFTIEIYDLNVYSVTKTLKPATTIRSCYYDKKDDLVTIVCYPYYYEMDEGEMFIINGDDYGVLAYIKGGYAFMPDTKEIFVDNFDFGYSVLIYKTYEELIADAKERYPGEELSEEKKYLYNIE